MAKVKQKKSVQELLQEAIIPNNQVPFSIPDNWCWVKVKTLGALGMGQTILSKDLKDSGVPVYSATEADKYFGYIDRCDNLIKLSIGDIVIPARGTIGYVKYVDCYEASCTQTTMFYKPIIKEMGKYIYYFFKGFKDRLFAYYGNAIPQITIKNVSEELIPLAPLEEQKRIVDKIGSLFSKLDEAKELIQKSLDKFENRKAAILYKAIHGQLIKKTTSWNKVILKDVVYEFQYGTSKKSEKKGKAIVIRMGNLQAGKIDWNDLAYSNDDEDILKYKLQKGDVLFNRTNSAALVGKTSIYEDERLAIFAGYLIRLKYDKNLIIGRFLNYLLNSQDAKEYCSRVKTDAVNQSNINAKKIAMFSFMLPSLDEQQEIVRILDSFFEKEDKSKELLDMIDQIEEMKKSILSRAFRGELGTHSDTDEPAIELVKGILKEAK